MLQESPLIKNTTSLTSGAEPRSRDVREQLPGQRASGGGALSEEAPMCSEECSCDRVSCFVAPRRSKASLRASRCPHGEEASQRGSGEPLFTGLCLFHGGIAPRVWGAALYRALPLPRRHRTAGLGSRSLPGSASPTEVVSIAARITETSPYRALPCATVVSNLQQTEVSTSLSSGHEPTQHSSLRHSYRTGFSRSFFNPDQTACQNNLLWHHTLSDMSTGLTLRPSPAAKTKAGKVQLLLKQGNVSVNVDPVKMWQKKIFLFFVIISTVSLLLHQGGHLNWNIKSFHFGCPTVPRGPRTKLTSVVFLKTHKTASSTMQNLLFRFAERHNLTVALPVPACGHQFCYPRTFTSHFVHPHTLPQTSSPTTCDSTGQNCNA
ncbi:hypothetical protein WMY93_014612 [Mugilogobius chulae]|uniref:Uncharacterized protein n=1 Tax=Mugilogobius chulae TaxID=88201 RepID=A0AAW0P4Z2_9GOBI